MSARVILENTILEGTTAVYTVELVDQNGDGINVNQLSSMTLTYYDLHTNAIINGRENQNIFDNNNVTITTETSPVLKTTLRWDIQPEDSIIVDARRELEPHVALFRWRWALDTRVGSQEIQFDIENLSFVS